MKKVLSLVLVLTLVLGSFSFAFAAPSDVVGTEYEEAVERLGQLGVLEGYTDGTFKPNNTITRAEFAAVVVRVKGLEAAAQAAKGATAFSDVPAGNWAAGYINIASKMGFVKGMGDGTFAPSAPVTYEQAVTMVIRALGYDPAAEARGGYPYGYLIVANENGLLDAVKGTQGLPAPRGLVAQLVDNALEIPLMVQVGFGTQTKWVVSGTEDTKEVYLLDDLGFDKVARERVVSINSDKNEIRFEKYGKAKVAEGFDFEEVYGLRLNAWLDGKGKVVIYTKADTPKYEATKGGEKITIVSENKKYAVADKATLLLNDKEVEASKFTADYARIVFNSDDEIVWARGYTWDDTFVVKETEKEVAYSFDKDKLELKNYTIVKEGKDLGIEGLEEGDVLFFNKTAKFAVVHNDSKVGEIEKVYTESFKFDGDDYDYNAGNYDVKFVDEDVVGIVDKDVAAAMKDEGEVEVFFDFAGTIVVIKGERGETKTNYFFGMLTANSQVEGTSASRQYYTFDLLNNEGKIKKYDVSTSYVTKYGASWAADMVKGRVVKVTVDEDGDFVKAEALKNPVTLGSNDTIKVEATHAKGYQIQDSTVVFITDGRGSGTVVSDYDVVKWTDAAKKFSVIKAGEIYSTSRGRVDVIIADSADIHEEYHLGLVTDVKKVRSSDDIWEVTIMIAGEEKVYETVKGITGVSSTLLEGRIVEITLTDAGKISYVEVEPYKEAGKKVVRVSTSSNELTVADAVYSDLTYELIPEAVVYDATGSSVKKINLRDLSKNDTVNVFMMDDETDTFVKYVVRTALAGTTPDTPKGQATVRTAFAIDSSNDKNIYLTVGNNLKVYTVLKTALIEDADGNVMTTGNIAKDKVINFVLVEGTDNIAYIQVLN
ncbi:S-layer homology domain-containing protein [Proteiniborus sp. MB09-C3]|uniref:S-layer homology domain-containing protein n=1 Tax=Proteiniborus sp. MB09-C3 TaxID=3050072 RepID=UPI0025559E4E|nr:S-layer homology domain-containing protein [Proteiniborus sp. MB09-C3]WIV12244.1 S-layer homology domain-containing protein [Proteiniborus sp. MB09-C3]